MNDDNNTSFSSQLGFVLAAAASAVGLGNLWRFPYCAAKDGGGIFLLVYLIVTITFGFTMLTTEISIGRKMKKSTILSYTRLKKSWRFIGYLGCIVPFIIFPYYCVIGGWVLKYLFAFLTGNNIAATDGKYFVSFITSTAEPIIMTAIFLLSTAYIVYRGVNAGIESSAKYMMPLLIVLILIISGYSLTLSHTDAAGTRTAIEGLSYCLVPNFEGMTLSRLLGVALDAVGQSFYSISVAMGIMVTYGAYMRDESNLTSSVDQIAFFDTLVAFLAAIMILPAVFVFVGPEGLKASGPGLIFIMLPKIFMAMGSIGVIIGIMFFALVFFAAITSSVSLMEAVVANIMECTGINRSKAVLWETVLGLIIAVIVCLGYNVFYFEVPMLNGSKAQILDLLDYFSNNLLMPLTGIFTCLLIGWVLNPKVIIDEAVKNGEPFLRKPMYIAMVKYIAPVMLLILLVYSTGILS